MPRLLSVIWSILTKDASPDQVAELRDQVYGPVVPVPAPEEGPPTEVSDAVNPADEPGQDAMLALFG